MPIIDGVYNAVCNQCHWQWKPRTKRPRKCVNPKCQATDWDGPHRERRKYTKSWVTPK